MVDIMKQGSKYTEHDDYIKRVKYHALRTWVKVIEPKKGGHYLVQLPNNETRWVAGADLDDGSIPAQLGLKPYYPPPGDLVPAV